MSMLEAKLVCKKHPYNNPQQGVCSSCLAEKLSNLSTPCNYHYPNNTSLSYSSSTKSKYSTQLGAPTNHYKIHDHDSNYSSGTGHARHGSIDHNGNVVVVDNNIDGIKKSRSMIGSRKSRPDDGVVIKKKGGGGFLAKLIRSTSKTTKGDDHVVMSTDHSRGTTTMFVPTKV